MPKKGILYSEFMGKIERQKIRATCVTSVRSMGSEDSFEFLAIAFADFGIDIRPNDDLGVFWNKLQKRVEGFDKFFMGNVMTGVID